jgi:S1-C subfamily serine protease
VQGSGWAAGPGLVATNAHVIAGQDDTRVLTEDDRRLDAEPVYVDARDDVALLRVPGLDLTPLALGDAPGASESVVLLGHPEGGPLRAEAATATRPRTVLARDAYGDGPVARQVIVTRGTLGPGSSGGPIVDPRGRVVAMIFGGSEADDTGAAVPSSQVRDALDGPLAPVGAGPCTG